MLIWMRDMTRGVMLPRWPWKIMHTRGESILPICGPKVSGGNWWPRFGSSTAFSPLFGENSLKQEDQEKYQVLRLMANALSISFSWWVAITLAILPTWVFEASFRRGARAIIREDSLELRKARWESCVHDLDDSTARSSCQLSR